MKRALAAGALYAVALFALGFLLGTLRVMLVVPMLGEFAATLIELPLMLTAAYVMCRWIVRRWRVAERASTRAAMALSFLLLMLLFEAVLGLTLMGRTAAEQAAAFATPSGLAGLAAQTISALFVFLVDRSGRR